MMSEQEQTALSESLRKERTRKLFLCGAFLLPFLWVLLLRIITFAGAENSAEAFFHIRFSERGIAGFFDRDFSAVYLAPWREAFADGEWLFHFLLWISGGLRKIAGFETAAPFHWEYLFFLVLLNASFIFAARWMGIRARTIFAGCLLPPLLSVPSAMRLMMLQPHILALPLLFFMTGSLACGSLNGRIWKSLLWSFLFSWSFDFPQIAVLTALFFAVFSFRQDSWKGLLLPAASLMGIVLGGLIHPQSPNVFSLRKMRSFDVIFHALDMKTLPELILPEWCPPDGRDFVCALPLYLLAFVILLLVIRHLEYRGRNGLSAPVLATAASALFFTLASIWLRRTVEFAVPFAVLAFLALADSAARDDIPYPQLKKHWKKCAWLLFCVTLCWGIVTSCLLFLRMQESTSRFSDRIALRQALKQGFRADYILLNGDCADFPVLYYEAPHLCWLWGGDPAYFMKDHRKKLENLTSPVAISAEQISRDTGLHYLVLLDDGSEKRRARKQYFLDCGWRLIGDFSGEGWIFTDLPEKR